MEAGKIAAALIAALLITISLASRSHAQMMAPEPLETVLPERWHPPLSRFLREFRASKIEEIVASAKGQLIDGRSELVLIRLEHESACFTDGTCLTIIGEARGQDIILQAMFVAGKWMTRGDVFPNILGTAFSTPLLFCTSSNPLTATHVVALLETRRGWIVSTAR